MSIYAVGFAYLLFVFFKAFQQRNIAFMHYWWVMPTSFLMATTDVFVTSLVAINAVRADSLWEIVPYIVALGIGGGCGAMGAMALHHKYITRRL